MRRAVLLALAAALAAAAPAPAQTGGAPDVRAPSAIVMEASTGDVAFARRASQKRSIASTTKLMTALISAESVALDDVLTAAPYDPAPAESVVGLRTGERMTVRDLLRALMLPSANDAAVTLATGISGSVPAFVEEMNRRARQLGLRDTSYANPVGLDEAGNRSSARDLVRLAAVLRRNAFLRRTTDLPRATLTSGSRRRVVVNRNRLVRQVPDVDGVKTGRTQQAGYVLVGSATRGGVTVLSAVLGESSEAARDADSLALLRYGLDRYRRETVVRRGATLARADLEYRDEQVRLVAGRSVSRVLRRGRRATVRVTGAPAELDGPLNAGARVGTVEVRERGRVVARTPLVTANAVEEAGLSTRLSALLSQPLTLVLIALVLACTVLLVLLRRRVVRRAGIR
jgi:serine-type D-Ala-D-Ala carboxypeptidase (penicillin-binding protein 5/6)